MNNGIIALPNVILARDEYAKVREGVVRWTEEQIERIPDSLSIHDAAAYAKIYELRAKLHGDAQHMARFLLGIVALRVKESAEHGSDPIGRCAEMWNIHANTLRYYVKAAKKTKGNIRYFDRWLKAGDYQKTQADLIRFTQVMKDPQIMPPDVAADIVKRKIEEAAESIDEMADPEEQHSASIILTESAGRYLEASETQRKTYKVIEPPDEFLDFLGQCYCMGCGVPPPDEGRHDTHHVKPRGTAQSSSNWAQIPLCRTCHQLIHKDDYAHFKAVTGVDVREALLTVWHLWLAGEELYLPTQLTR